jgi:hypothetical protein
MRAVLISGACLALAAMLAGCGSSGQPSATTGTHTAAASSSPSAPASASAPLAFGKTAMVSDANGNAMTVTPVAAWWLPGNVQKGESGTESAENGEFLIIELRVTAQASGASFPAPITGSGPMVYSHGQTFGAGNTQAADNTVWGTCLPTIDSTTQMPPGQPGMDGETYDVPAGPALLEWSAPGSPAVR